MKIYSIPVLLLLAGSIMAQSNEGIPDSEVDIIKTFEPTLIKADKIPINPSLPKIVADKPEKQTYAFTEKNVPIEYKAEDIKPMKYSPPKADPLPIVYLKAGFGTQFTPIAQLSITNRKWEKLKAGLNTDFIMSNGKKPENKDYLNFSTKGWGAFQVNYNTIGVDANVGMRRYNYYGLNENDTLSPQDSTKIKYNDFGLKLSLFNHEDNRLGLNYKGTFGVNWMNNHFAQKEILISGDADVSKNFKEKFDIGLMFNANNMIINNGKGNNSTLGVTLTPYAKIKLGIWSLQAGPSIIHVGGDIYGAPYLKNEIAIYKNYLVMYNHWIATHRQQDMIAMTKLNPFLSADTRYGINVTEERTFAGLKGAFPKGFAYDVRFTQWIEKNTLLFQYDTADAIVNNFTTVSEKRLSYFDIHSSLKYDWKGKLNAHADFDYFLYNTETQAQAWYRPQMQVQIGANYIHNKKFSAGMEFNIINGLKTLDDSLSITTLKPIVDININANYYLNKHIGFFAEINNAIAQQYKRWYNYPSYGIQCLAGVKITY